MMGGTAAEIRTAPLRGVFEGRVSMSDQPRVLVVDDELDIVETVAEYLELHGMTVLRANSAAEARALLAEQSVDLVMLDITMPGEDGLSLSRHVRESYESGIIFLTASGEVVDRIVGLEMGADDYMAKPVDLREMLARVRAVLRRLRVERAERSDASEKAGTRARFGRHVLDLDSHKLTDEDGNDVPLTSMEFDLLKAFAEHPGRVLSRDQLLDMAHNRDWEPFDRSIDIRIARIRRKIEPDPSKPQVIKTVRGAGYLYAPSNN